MDREPGRAADSGEDASEAGRPRLKAGSEQALVRISVWQTVLSLLGFIVAIIALYAALTESGEMRRQTAAAVWPYVQLTILDVDAQDRAEFSIVLTNAGAGPAKLDAVTLEIDGTAMTGWAQAIKSLVPESDQVLFLQNFSRHRVLAPGERVSLFGVSDPTVVKAFREVLARRGGSISYCYCSIFDDCWLFASEAPDQVPQAVPYCPDVGEAAVSP
ncbi:MAG: hypothetical protein H6985_04035 [Pseudomonadales bacterium]|nr:hypothetical protein [Halioglobus sp.]MCP5128736.1 hypothetical protein [Pseudomonadales bacterium]